MEQEKFGFFYCVSRKVGVGLVASCWVIYLDYMLEEASVHARSLTERERERKRKTERKVPKLGQRSEYISN